MTIRTKLTLWYAGLLTLIIVVFSATMFGVLRVSMLNAIDESLDQTAKDVIQNVGVFPRGEFGSLDTGIYFRSDDIFRVPGFSIQVWQTHDRGEPITPVLMRRSSDLDNFNRPLDENNLTAITVEYSNIVINQIPGRVTTRPFSSAGGQQVGIVQVAAPMQAIQQVGESLLAIMLAASSLAILMAWMMGMWLSNRVLVPIHNITNAAARIATADDLTTRLPWSGPMDELGRLTKVFNHMMERLEHLFAVQQRFVADVSHELRTPLTAMRGNLEMIERYGMDKLALDAIHTETDRMARMVNDLLLLARADYGEMKVELYPTDLDTVVLSVFEQGHMLAKDRNLTLQLGKFEPLRVEGNPDRLRQLILNLVNNAIKYTPDGGKITLSAYREQDRATIKVQDTGIGIPKDNISHIFERFYQVDDSRVHHNDSDGSGLGLSIVKWITDVHNGTIEVDSEIGKGTTFTVRLPLPIETHYFNNGQHLQSRKPTRPRLPKIIRVTRPERDAEQHTIQDS